MSNASQTVVIKSVQVSTSRGMALRDQIVSLPLAEAKSLCDESHARVAQEGDEERLAEAQREKAKTLAKARLGEIESQLNQLESRARELADEAESLEAEYRFSDEKPKKSDKAAKKAE